MVIGRGAANRRRIRRRLFALVCAGATVASATAAAGAAALPPGFEQQVIASGLRFPTDVEFAPDGRTFIAEKEGAVRVLRADGTLAPAPVVDIRNHVNTYVDHGLLGIAVDTDFATNGYLYLLYVYEDNPLDRTGPKRSRLTRVTVRSDNTSTTETVLLGKYQPGPLAGSACPAPSNTVDCIPADSPSHVIGTVISDSDGTLWVGSGDANSHAADKTKSLRAYDERSYAGKVLHVDRNGRGLPGHPFCPTNGNLSHVCTKVHASGFRNPFRFILRPDGRGVAVADVGQSEREEVNLVKPGKSYGWPCYEGDIRTPGLGAFAACDAEYAKEGTPQAHQPPTWAYAHTDAGGGVIAGPVYTGDSFPSEHRNTMFVGDFVQGWVKRLVRGENDQLVAVEDFTTGWFGVDLEQMPDGRLASVHFGGGRVEAYRFAGGNRTPVAVAIADPTAGDLPLEVRFTGSGSSDPDGDPITYDWDFGDGSPHSAEPDPTHVYQEAGVYTARLTVTDPGGASGTAEVRITAGNRPPDVAIEAPVDEALYQDGRPVELRGAAVDPEDGELSGPALRWTIILHHNTHIHAFDELTGSEASFTPLVDHDADSFYEIRLEATDSRGLAAVETVEIRPQTARFTIDSDPSGAEITYADTGYTAPFSTIAAVGFRVDVSAADTLTYQGVAYEFDRWSDGGAQLHAATVPEQDTTLVARYRKVDRVQPKTTITSGPIGATAESTPTFEFTANEPATFICGIDSRPFVQCSSPYTTPPLANGQHSFRVKAIDSSGNHDPQWATRSFQVLAFSTARRSAVSVESARMSRSGSLLLRLRNTSGSRWVGGAVGVLGRVGRLRGARLAHGWFALPPRRAATLRLRVPSHRRARLPDARRVRALVSLELYGRRGLRRTAERGVTLRR